MVDSKKKESKDFEQNKKGIGREGEQVSPVSRETSEAFVSGKEAIAEKEKLPESEEKLVLKEAAEKAEADLSQGSKAQAGTQAQQMQSLPEEEKIKQLLSLAKKKGVAYAVYVAKKMNDAYILDALHDILAKEGYYRKFTK